MENLNEVSLSEGLVPEGVIAHAKVRLTRGGHITDLYTDGWATKSKSSESVYLVCDFVILDGEYKDCMIKTMIGLYSPKSDFYRDKGLRTRRRIIDSAYNLDEKVEDSRRNIENYGVLDGLVCVIKSTVKIEQYNGVDKPKNDVLVLTPRDEEYKAFKLQSEATTSGNGRYKIEATKKKAVPEVELIDDEIPF